MPGMNSEQSIFISTRPAPVFNLAVYLLSSILCISCPVRTIIRKRTMVKTTVHKKRT